MDNKGTEGTYTFTKLKGIENYKQRAREMGFALQDAGLESYADGTSIKPKLYTESEKTPAAFAIPLSEEKIEKRQAEVDKWILNSSKANAWYKTEAAIDSNKRESALHTQNRLLLKQAERVTSDKPNTKESRRWFYAHVYAMPKWVGSRWWPP